MSSSLGQGDDEGKEQAAGDDSDVEGKDGPHEAVLSLSPGG
jgi:hypothetical protein